MQIIYFILSCYGLTQILVYSKILTLVRPEHHFFHCSMCVGFWVGVLLLFLNPFTELFTFDISVVNALILGSLSSGVSYALTAVISDGGIQIEYRTKGNVDAKMETETSRQVLQG